MHEWGQHDVEADFRFLFMEHYSIKSAWEWAMEDGRETRDEDLTHGWESCAHPDDKEDNEHPWLMWRWTANGWDSCTHPNVEA